MEITKRLYRLSKEQHDYKTIATLLLEHPEIQFVSLLGMDLKAHVTEEKIPIRNLLEDVNGFLTNGIQTDGSSVELYGIATLDNARVDILPDLEVDWFVDYNYENLDEETHQPVGTLKIPSFLIHNGKEVCSRSILKRAISNFQKQLLGMLPYYDDLHEFGIQHTAEVKEVLLTTATELEFWVKTPEDQVDSEKLHISQQLKEQYWKKIQGKTRTALEKTLYLMECYGFKPEMGHKEVGGVSSTIDHDGHYNHIMEQIEIDWKYSDALLAADHDLFVRDLVTDVFQSYGLEVTFKAKAIEGVAGSGKHTHIGVAIKRKDGIVTNLFSKEDDYLSSLGYGALMGILKNYEAINPFVSDSTDAFNRLKPGFEAPVCIVTSIGKSVTELTRNRSVLIGLIREPNNPLATRFELRSPNPFSNTYLVLSACYQAMLDGMSYVVFHHKTTSELETELSKAYGEEAEYLDKDRMYRSEHDVFEHYTSQERFTYFGNTASTVYEAIQLLEQSPTKKAVLMANGVLTDTIIKSFCEGSIRLWCEELKYRILDGYRNELRSYKKLHEDGNELDVLTWNKIEETRNVLMKNNITNKSLISRLIQVIDEKDYASVSKYQLEVSQKMNEIRSLYRAYQKNSIAFKE